MLKHLLIKNYVLIKKLSIDPSANLNIITGETGAGKSIMLGALGLLMGKRADTKVFYSDEKKCIIEGSFDVSSHQLAGLFERLELDYEPTTIIRREIAPNGKSRAFINDTPVNLETLKKVGLKLMDIHSQHDTQLLGSAAFQLRIVDAYAQNQAHIDKYTNAYAKYRKAADTYQNLVTESQQINDEHDFNLHQYEELRDAALEDIDQKALEEELQLLENAESIQQNLSLALEALSNSEYAAESSLKTAEAALHQIGKFGEKLSQLKERVSSNLIELLDIVMEIEREESELFFDQERTQAIQDTLNQLYTLQQKHKVEDVNALIAIRDGLQAQIDKVLNFDEDLAKAKASMEEAFEQVQKKAEKLSATRIAVIPKIEKKLDELLTDVGIPNGKVSIDRSVLEPSPTGIDDINFLFTANKGMAPAPLKSVASGGEFSRLMLCIKYILASKVSLPTIIFDEIDTGVSGEVAIRVGNMMKEMAHGHQLITITHLPQIAAKGEKHYYVYKDDSSDRTVSHIKQLDTEERVNEIAQMIGGINPSEIAYLNARELMNT
ncbi:MAG: DNA repair protein RecN [Flammeovirgaceae bacterium]